jgi:hypothetical protein
LAVVNTFPAESPATHKVVEGQEMDWTAFEPSMLASVQAPAPPVGVVEVNTLPLVSPATHRVGLHEIELNSLKSRCVVVQAGVPPVGAVEVTTFPVVEPTPTHNVVVGHDISSVELIPEVNGGLTFSGVPVQLNEDAPAGVLPPAKRTRPMPVTRPSAARVAERRGTSRRHAARIPPNLPDRATSTA